MTEGLLDTALAVAGRARPGEEIEAFVTHEKTYSVKVYGGVVEQVSAAEPRGVSARVWRDGRIGFAYSTDLSEEGLAEVVDMARDNAAHATSDEALALPDPPASGYEEVAGMVDQDALTYPPEKKIEFALELERLTLAADPRIRSVEEAVYSDQVSGAAIASSRGVAGSFLRTDAWCYPVAIAEDQGDTEVGFEFGLARGPGALDAEAIAGTAAGRAAGVLGAKKIPSARMAVVFEPYVAGQFLSVLASALLGEAVQKGRSLFAGRLGEEVAGREITLVDDGRIEGAPGSAPFDGEGIPTGRTEVVSSGRLAAFLYDTISARRAGTVSTGNASRGGFKAPPGPSPTNLAFDPTGEGPHEVYRAGGRALLVQDFHGVHSGANPVSGDFSVGVTGRVIEGGQIGAPVKEVTIASPMLDILAGIRAVADDRRWLPFGGSYGGATTLIEEMTVGGL